METNHLRVTLCWVCTTFACCKPAKSREPSGHLFIFQHPHLRIFSELNRTEPSVEDRLFWYKSAIRSKPVCYICTFLRVKKQFPSFICRSFLSTLLCHFCPETIELLTTCHCGNFTIPKGQMVIFLFCFLFFLIAAIWKLFTWSTTFGTWVEFAVITKTKVDKDFSQHHLVSRLSQCFCFFSLNLLLFKRLFGSLCTSCLQCSCFSPWTPSPTELHLILENCGPWRWLSSKNEIIFNCQG